MADKEDIQFGMVPEAPATDAFELANFETLVDNSPLPNVMWSIEKHKVAQMVALSGLSKAQISRETGVPLSTINRWLTHGEFSEYINTLVLESASVMKAKRLQLLTKILDARIAEAETTNDYARLSKLDTLDIINAIRKETGEEEKRDESKYTQILEKIVGITSQPPKVIPTKPTNEIAE
jgi:hypothetical protein